MTDIAWAAGLFEGEGTVSRSISKNKTIPDLKRFQSQLTMTDLDVVNRFHAVVEVGSVIVKWTPNMRNKNQKTQFCWSTNGPKVEQALLPLLPYFGLRRTIQYLKVERFVHGPFDIENRVEQILTTKRKVFNSIVNENDFNRRLIAALMEAEEDD